MKKVIRLMVVDDSSVMRNLISEMVETEPDIEVVAKASNGVEALKVMMSKKIDVITMDIEMPKMDGLTALQHIMEENPTPVIMFSAMDKRHADIVMKSLDYGAVDFISKTSGTLSLDIEKIKNDIVSKVRMASKVNVRKITKSRTRTPLFYSLRRETATKDKVVAIGASTGGPKALLEVLTMLPRTFPAGIIISQHMPAGFTKSFAERLNWQASLEVKEAEDGDPIEPGMVLVAPGDYHLTVESGAVKLNQEKKVHSVRPSVDVMMKSAADYYGKNTVGVLLTGMGADGAEGMKLIKDYGGKTIAQDENSCVVFGMPREAIALGAVDIVAPLDRIPSEMLRAI